MALVVKTKKQDSTCYVSAEGAINSDTAAYFYDTISDELDETVNVLVLNMSGVVHMSSMGLSMLAKLKKKVEILGGVFMITQLQPQIQKLLKVVKALPLLNVFKSTEEADAYLDRIQKGELKDRRE